MPSRAKKLDRAVARLPSIPKELAAQFLTGPMTGEAINAAGIAFKQALIEASLNAELTHHLGYAPGSDRPEPTTNQRNGFTAKTVLTGDGKMRIETPRDRDGSFEPLLLPKHARRFTAFDDSIVALYARGLTVREIQGYLAESYGTEVSPDLISTVTDGVLAEVTAWQARPLETVYPVVFFDALRVKVREDNVVRMCGRPLGCKRKSEKSDGRVDCDHVSGLCDAAPCPLAQMGSAIQPQTTTRLRKPWHGTGSLDRRFDRSSSHSALSPRHQRTRAAFTGRYRQAAARVIVAHAVWAILLFNHGRSLVAVRSPEAQRDRIRQSPARHRREHCPVDCLAASPASRHTRPAARRPRRSCRSSVGSGFSDRPGGGCE